MGTRHGVKPSHFHGYARKASLMPALEVTYFGETLDGIHSYDVYGTPPGRERRLIGVVKRTGNCAHGAWRGGYTYQCKSLVGAVNWVVSRAATTGEILFPRGST
jgi:hypothetical protein